MADEEPHAIKKADFQQFSSQELQGEDGEEEEALSLCELPLNHDSTNKCNSFNNMSSNQTRQSSLSETSEFFEFSNDFGSDMRPADEIIFCGKLVPFKDKKNFLPIHQIHEKPVKDPNKLPIRRRRSESLSELQSSVSRSNSVSTCCSSRHSIMGNSRSLDYRKLRRSSSSVIVLEPETERNSSASSVAQSETVIKKATKPRWYSVMFGMVKVPPEMELSDMKNRQVRRNPSTTMFPTRDAEGKLAVNRNSGKVSWRILKALSCKESVSVTTSFAVPQAT